MFWASPQNANPLIFQVCRSTKHLKAKKQEIRLHIYEILWHGVSLKILCLKETHAYRPLGMGLNLILPSANINLLQSEKKYQEILNL